MKLSPILGLLCLALCSNAQSISLQDALVLARNNRSSVQAAQLNVDRARQSAQALGTYPGLTFGIGQSSRSSLGATDQDLFVVQTIDVFGRTTAARNLGRGQLMVAHTEQRQSLLSLQTEVLKSYFEAMAAAQLSDASEDLLNVATSLHRATVRRFEEGKIAEVQLTRATIEIDRAKQTAALRKSELKAASKRLAGVLGSKLEPVDVDSGAELQDPAVDLNNRPDISTLAARLRVAQAEAAVSSKSLLPELELIGLRSPWRDQDPSFGARIQLNWRVDWGRGQKEQSSGRKAAKAIAAYLADLKERAKAELEAIDIDIAAARERVETYQTIRKSAADLVDKTQIGYANGYSTLLDVLEATRSLREVEQELAEAQLSLNLALTSKYEIAGTLIEVSK